jgi:hypothetical protein
MTRPAIARAAGDEHSEQVAVVAYLQMSYPDVLFWATPNGAMMGGGRAGAIRMNALKAEGLLPGVSDLIIFEPRGGYSAMFLEMKRADGGSGASDNQLWFIRQVEQRGAFGIVCNGYDEAQPVIDDYLAGRIVKQPLDK